MVHLVTAMLLAAAVLLFTSCAARQQSFTVYELASFSGNFFSVMHGTPDLSNVAGFLGQSQRSCVSGWWHTYRAANYTNPYLRFDYGDPICYPFNFMSGVLSLRHLGPANTSDRAISLYSETQHLGQELIIKDPQTPQIPFHAQALFVTGHSNWTLFEGQNFTGTLGCFQSHNEVVVIDDIPYTDWNMTTIGSVIRGCAGVGYPQLNWDKGLNVRKVLSPIRKFSA